MSNQSKRRKIAFISPDRRPPQEHSERMQIDWTKCILCQKTTKEQLQCTFNTKSQDSEHIKSVYIELAERMVEFKNEGVMPINIDFDALSNGSDLGQSLYDNQGRHHKSCKILFSNSKLELAKRRKASDSPVGDKEQEQEPRRDSGKTRSAAKASTNELYFFCDQPSKETYTLHLVQTFRLGNRVRRCANLLDDSLLHAKLQKGDLIAQDAMYHNKCITELYRMANFKQLEGHYTETEIQLHGIALSERVAFIEESSIEPENGISVFKLSDLNKMYVKILQDLRLKVDGRIHSTRLKNRILAQFEDLREYKEGKEVFLAFISDIGQALSTAASINYDV